MRGPANWILTADLPEIFHQFRQNRQVDKAYSATEGTYLGPTIAKWISDTHHSEPTGVGMEHRGTTVFLSFSLAKQKKHQKYAPASVDLKIQESRYRGVVLDIQLNSRG